MPDMRTPPDLYPPSGPDHSNMPTSIAPEPEPELEPELEPMPMPMPMSTPSASAPPPELFPDSTGTITTDPEPSSNSASTTIAPSAINSKSNPQKLTSDSISELDSEQTSALGVHEAYVRSLVRQTEDWPTDGVTFLDFSPVLCDARAFRRCVDVLVGRYSELGVTHVAGIDARGFIFASALAYALGCGFVMIRKINKLPPRSKTDPNYALLTESYGMEYSESQSLQVSADVLDSGGNAGVTRPRVVVVDDLLATGGTAIASCNLLRDAGATVVEVAVAIEVMAEGLCGREKLKKKAFVELFSLLPF